jgi:hypothetical protein
MPEDIINQINSLVEQASIENQRFGTTASQLIILLSKYKSGNVIPAEFWELFEGLANIVGHDSSGKLKFTQAQYAVMMVINVLMKTGGLAITIPNKETIQKNLSKAFFGLPKSHILEGAFLPPFLDQIGNSVDFYGFLGIVRIGMMNASAIISSQDDFKQSVDLAKTILLDASTAVFESFWENPEIIKRAKEQISLLWAFTSGSIF